VRGIQRELGLLRSGECNFVLCRNERCKLEKPADWPGDVFNRPMNLTLWSYLGLARKPFPTGDPDHNRDNASRPAWCRSLPLPYQADVPGGSSILNP
jgi:hypothetical protein